MRRPSFEESLRELPKHFAADGDLVGSHIIAVLSAVFPDGEDFFVRSVRAFRPRIDEPELARAVKGFVGQEAVHGREHRVLNECLDELGYPTKAIEGVIRRTFAVREKIMSEASNLAATAALEHYTAVLAELLLTSEAMRHLLGAEGVRDLFLWHALEESEHKAVAFDVYKAVGGSERTRVWTMNLVTVGFLATIGAFVTLSLLRDPSAWRPRRLRRSLRRLRTSPLWDRALWRQLRDYNRPDFHPYDRDTTELVQKWRRELFGEPVPA